MERLDRTTWQKHVRPQDRSALVTVLTIVLAVVVVLVLVLF
jgi:hypothetical protein